MRRPRTLARYVTREVVLYTLLGLTSIGAILLLRNLGRALDELLGAGFEARDLWAVLRVIGTMLLLYALPVSFLFGVLLAIARMASDVEIVAMRACGIGVRDLAIPILALSLICSGLTFWLARDVEPAARREMRSLLTSLVARGAGLQPGRFRHFGDVLVYVDERGGDRLHGIVVSDRSDPERPLIVFASEGRLALDERGAVTLALERGDIHLDQSETLGSREVRISFERFDYTLDLAELLGDDVRRRPKELTWSDLRAAVARGRNGAERKDLREEPIAYELDLQRRLAAPLAPVLFGLIGLPIGMRRARGARAFGALWCAGIAFAYYGAQISFESLAEQGFLSAAAARWIPVAAFGVLAAVLLSRARRGS